MPWWADLLGGVAGVGATILTGGAAASAVPYIVGGVTALTSGLAEEVGKNQKENELNKLKQQEKTTSIIDQYKQANQAQQDFYNQLNRGLSNLSLQRSYIPLVGGWNKPYILGGQKEGLFEKQIPILTDNNPWFQVLKWQNFPYGGGSPIKQF